MKTVNDWKYFCTESSFCYIILFDNDEGEIVYKGWLDKVPAKYLDYEVQSFDPVDPANEYSMTLTLNIGKP